MTTDRAKLLANVADTMQERQIDYGCIHEEYHDLCIAAQALGLDLTTPRGGLLYQSLVKFRRMKTSPQLDDNYRDAIGYLVGAWQEARRELDEPEPEGEIGEFGKWEYSGAKT